MDENGAIDEKMLMVFVDENIPTKYHDAAFSIMADCVHHAGEIVRTRPTYSSEAFDHLYFSLYLTGNLDPTEASCKSYDPVFKCATESATKFAKVRYFFHHKFGIRVTKL